MNVGNWIERDRELYVQTINLVPSIIFKGFDLEPLWLLEYWNKKMILSAEQISELDRRGLTEGDEVKWVTKILKQESIAGEWLFSFSGPLAIGLVILQDTYNWVQPLWTHTHLPPKNFGGYEKVFNFFHPQVPYYLSIRWSESCPGDNCIIAERVGEQTSI